MLRPTPAGSSGVAQTGGPASPDAGEWQPNTAAEVRVTLDLLTAVAESDDHSQRSLAERLGVAVGLANAYVKRCVRKGWIKASSAPARRYLYYLTPNGFSEKARLTGLYLSTSLSFFRMARQQCAELLDRCAHNGWRRVGLVGTGDLSEIAIVSALGRAVDLVGIVDAPRAGGTFTGLPILAAVADLGPIDAVLILDVACDRETFVAAVQAVGEGRVMSPRLLGLLPAAAAPPPPPAPSLAQGASADVRAPGPSARQETRP
ncbi:MAG: winged helix-turn-helix transcriptional regulator [Alphaproteobacteria bacterium]|nr:winged helix-turn-helix transcriptional regulator [Alphaproteobacteria bacterium]